MIVLVGVGHVFDIKAKVKEMVLAYGPEVVGVELDVNRYEGLKRKVKKDSRLGVPFIFQVLGKIQDQIASNYNVMAGEEMLSAVKAANETGARVALIDMDLNTIVQRFRDPKTIPEKLKLLFSIAVGILFAKSGKKKGKTTTLEGEIENFEREPQKYIDELEREFPVLKHELIDRRNEYMSRSIVELNHKYKKIMAVVGAGHLGGMERILRKAGKETYVVKLTDILRKKEAKYHQILDELRAKGRGEDEERAMKLRADGEEGQVGYSVNVQYEMEGDYNE